MSDEIQVPQQLQDLGALMWSKPGIFCVEIFMGSTSQDGAQPAYLRSPYRDGAHGSWDGQALGDLPRYVIRESECLLLED